MFNLFSSPTSSNEEKCTAQDTTPLSPTPVTPRRLIPATIPTQSVPPTPPSTPEPLEFESITKAVGIVHDIVRLNDALLALFEALPGTQVTGPFVPYNDLLQELEEAAEEFFKWEDEDPQPVGPTRVITPDLSTQSRGTIPIMPDRKSTIVHGSFPAPKIIYTVPNIPNPTSKLSSSQVAKLLQQNLRRK